MLPCIIDQMENVSFSEQFAAQEAAYRSFLPSGQIIGLRLDGKAFHTFTRQFAAPFDLGFMAAMDDAARAVVDELAGVLMAHIQSDEISVILSDRVSNAAELPFGGRVDKVLSIAAATASVGLYQALVSRFGEISGVPVFDARVGFVGDLAMARDYLTWRRLDARRNAVSMAVECVLPKKRLVGLGLEQRVDALKGTPYEVLPDGFYFGRLLVWEMSQRAGVNQLTGETVPVMRRRLIDVPATRQAAEAAVKAVSERLAGGCDARHSRVDKANQAASC